MSSKHLLKASHIGGMPENAFVHPLNANAVRHTRSLSESTAMTALGVHLVRVEPGRDSTQYHTHHHEEEFLYILSGHGIAEIGGEEIPVGPGDFMGFGCHSECHNMRNEGPDDLVYLMAGQRLDTEICDYPRVKKRLVRVMGERQIIDRES